MYLITSKFKFYPFCQFVRYHIIEKHPNYLKLERRSKIRSKPQKELLKSYRNLKRLVSNVTESLDQIETEFLDADRFSKGSFDPLIREFNKERISRSLASGRKTTFQDELPQNPDVLTWSAKQQIRHLHTESPEEWTPEVLAECFAASPAQISQILRDERRLSPEQIAAHDRLALRAIERLTHDRQLERVGRTDSTGKPAHGAAHPLSPAARRERYRFAPDTVARRAVDSAPPVAPAFSKLVDESGHVRSDVLLDPAAITKLPADEKRYLSERLDEIYKHKSGQFERIVQHYLDRKVVSSRYSTAAGIGTQQTNRRLLPPAASSNSIPKSASASAPSKPNAPVPDDETGGPDFFTDCLRNERAELRTRVAHSLLGALHPRARPPALTRVTREAHEATPIAGERATQLVAHLRSTSWKSPDGRPSPDSNSSAALRDKYAAFVPPAGTELPADEKPERISERPSGPTAGPEFARDTPQHTAPPTLQPLTDEYVLERDVILKVPKYRQSSGRSASSRSRRRDAASVGADSWFAGMGFRPNEQ